MKYLEIPRYKELSVKYIWSFVREVQALSSYFPTLQPNQLPDRDFMLSVLSTIRYDELHKMIQNARKHRSIKALEANDDLIHISKKMYEKINGVLTQKRKKSICLFFN